MIGCNDSFGYLAADEVAPDQYRNFTAPHTQSDDLLLPSTIFEHGLQYPGGERSLALGVGRTFPLCFRGSPSRA